MGSLENDQSIITFSIDGRNFCYNYNALVKSLNIKEDVGDGRQYYINIFCDWVKNEHASEWNNKHFHCLAKFDQGEGGRCGERLFFKLTIQAGSSVYFDAVAMNLLFLKPPESQTFSFNVVPTKEKVRVGNYLAVRGVSMSHGQADPNREGHRIYTLEKLTDENAEKIKKLNEVIVSMNPNKSTKQLDPEVIQKIEEGMGNMYVKKLGQFSELFSKESLATHPIPENCETLSNADHAAQNRYTYTAENIDPEHRLNTHMEQQMIDKHSNEKDNLFAITNESEENGDINLLALMNTTVIGITPENYPNGLIIRTIDSYKKEGENEEENYYKFIKKPNSYSLDDGYQNELPLHYDNDPVCYGYDHKLKIDCHDDSPGSSGVVEAAEDLNSGGILKNIEKINALIPNVEQKISINTPVIAIKKKYEEDEGNSYETLEYVEYLDTDGNYKRKEIFDIEYNEMEGTSIFIDQAPGDQAMGDDDDDLFTSGQSEWVSDEEEPYDMDFRQDGPPIPFSLGGDDDETSPPTTNSPRTSSSSTREREDDDGEDESPRRRRRSSTGGRQGTAGGKKKKKKTKKKKKRATLKKSSLKKKKRKKRTKKK